MYLEFMEDVIPHQRVLRPQSTSTKLRVVFDASSKTSSQVTLNEIPMVGPTIQEELYSTLLRFRPHRLTLTADVNKIYRQVMVNEADMQFQMIVWRRDPSESLRLYKLNTVSYGPKAADVIGSDFYVDYMLTDAACVEELISPHLREQPSP